MTIVERFERKILKTDGCWLWNACRCKKSGYGYFNLDGKIIGAHRVSYALFVNKFIDGLYICHKCDNPNCVNPNHLFAGTAKDNMIDCVKKGRARKSQRFYYEKVFGKEKVDQCYAKKIG